MWTVIGGQLVWGVSLRFLSKTSGPRLPKLAQQSNLHLSDQPNCGLKGMAMLANMLSV